MAVELRKSKEKFSETRIHRANHCHISVTAIIIILVNILIA